MFPRALNRFRYPPRIREHVRAFRPGANTAANSEDNQPSAPRGFNSPRPPRQSPLPATRRTSLVNRFPPRRLPVHTTEPRSKEFPPSHSLTRQEEGPGSHAEVVARRKAPPPGTHSPSAQSPTAPEKKSGAYAEVVIRRRAPMPKSQPPPVQIPTARKGSRSTWPEVAKADPEGAPKRRELAFERFFDINTCTDCTLIVDSSAAARYMCQELLVGAEWSRKSRRYHYMIHFLKYIAYIVPRLAQRGCRVVVVVRHWFRMPPTSWASVASLSSVEIREEDASGYWATMGQTIDEHVLQKQQNGLPADKCLCVTPVTKMNSRGKFSAKYPMLYQRPAIKLIHPSDLWDFDIPRDWLDQWRNWEHSHSEALQSMSPADQPAAVPAEETADQESMPLDPATTTTSGSRGGWWASGLATVKSLIGAKTT